MHIILHLQQLILGILETDILQGFGVGCPILQKFSGGPFAQGCGHGSLSIS